MPETGLRDLLLSQADLLGLNIKVVTSSVVCVFLTLPPGKIETKHSTCLQNQVSH